MLRALALAFAGCAGQPIAPEVLARMADRPAIEAGTIAIRWLGAAGFEIRSRNGSVLIDPYLTRASLGTLALGRLEPDREMIDRAGLEADLILVSHSHFDHLLDAPLLSVRTGAPILASLDACRIAKRLEPGARCTAVRSDLEFRSGAWDLTSIAAHHGEITILGVPIDGKNDGLIPEHPHMIDMRTGPTSIWALAVDGIVIVHVATAGLPIDPTALSKHLPRGADVLLIALALRDNTPGYARHLIDVLDPDLIVPHHAGLETDTLADPIDDDQRETFEAFRREEGDRVRIPRPFEPITFTRAVTARPGSRR